MTYAQMISLIPDKDSPVETVGNGFFSLQTSAADRKQLMEFLLDEKRYEQLFRLMYCSYINGHINMKNTSADFVAVTSGNSTINTRYFSLFLQTVNECGVSESKIVPMLFQAATAGKKSVLNAWKPSSVRYLTKLARADYNRAWEYLKANDTDFKLVSILLESDKERALRDLIEIALFGKSINKVALRRFLRGYKAEVLAYISPVYTTLKTDARVNAVRLLLVFKNDAEVMPFLREISRTEKAKSVLKLLESKTTGRHEIAGNPDVRQITKYFYEAMVLGTSATAKRFKSELIMPPFSEVADSLFFGVYRGGLLQNIIIVDKGRMFDLNNNPYEIPEDSEVKVFHACELNPKTEYLQRLNIEQPFEQIKRKVYTPSAADKRNCGCFGVAGTMVQAAIFKANMRRLGFRALGSDTEGVCSQVGLSRSGILCVLNIAPVELKSAQAESPVRAQSVRFYAEKDVVRLGGKMFVESVVPLSPARIEARVFSEFMYSIYDLMGCQ